MNTNFFSSFFSKSNLLAKAALVVLLFLVGIEIFIPPQLEKPLSALIYDRDSTLIHAYLSADDKWRMQISIEEVPDDLIKALINKEDNWFYYHPGVNPISIIRALAMNFLSGERTSGASTITMQLARLHAPKSRTYLNKIIEIFYAIRIELHYTKKEILETYLTHLPYGGNIEGVKAASYIYFGRPPSQLSLSQSVLLTIIPNRPNSLRLDRSGEEVLIAKDQWLKKFGKRKLFSPENIEQALSEGVNFQRKSLPREAPHFSRELRIKNRSPEVYSTLDRVIQGRAERLLKNYVDRVRGRDVSNGAVIIIDNKTSEVVGYCGSADFNDENSLGQVNGITAVRSPGSALKPSAFALAMDNGLITPETIMDDIPVNFGGYTPENYDRTFNGPVSVRFSLQQSLNIPSVKIVNQVGVDNYVEFLSNSGFATIEKKKKNLGLSVILGGCGVTLEELARFYSIFPNMGVLRPLKYSLGGDTSNTGKRVFLPETSWMMADILSGIERPDLPGGVLTAANKGKIAWKTGTSYGKRDAWSLGFTPEYTIGVWMGNFSGMGSQHLSGSVMAVPLLFELFSSLSDRRDNSWFVEPDNLYERNVCQESGLIPRDGCKHLKKDFFIHEVSHQNQCKLYKEVFINPDSTFHYCMECLPDSGYGKMDIPDYDPELLVWYNNEGKSYIQSPPHNPNCRVFLEGAGPSIVSPTPDFEYLIQRDLPQKVLLQAGGDYRVSKLNWYINGSFFQSSLPNERVFFSPKEGKTKITCTDDQGRSESIEIITMYY